METFAVGPRLVHGEDALACLEQFGGRRVLVVTDAGIAASPSLEAVLRRLSDAQVTVFDAVLPDPSTHVVAEGMRSYRAVEPYAVVAVGGGSVIDAAKAMHLVALEQGEAAEWGLAVVPTTSGSGSEVTSVAVVTDEEQQVKIPLSDERLMPRLAVLDPVVVVGCPLRVSADSGMDALTHAVEAYVATGADDFSDACAEKAIRLILQWLPRVLADPADLVARERMHNAATLAAVAFENAGLGITHSLAHAIGGHLPVAHGRLNSILLPQVIAFNAGSQTAPKPSAKRYWELAVAVGLNPAGRASGPARLIAAIRQLATTAQMPKTLAEAGVDPKAVTPLIELLAEQALADGCTRFNPVQPRLEDLQGIIRAIVAAG